MFELDESTLFLPCFNSISSFPKKRWFVLTKSHLHYADAEGLQPKMKWDLKDARVNKTSGVVSILPFRLLMRMRVITHSFILKTGSLDL